MVLTRATNGRHRAEQAGGRVQAVKRASPLVRSAGFADLFVLCTCKAFLAGFPYELPGIGML